MKPRIRVGLLFGGKSAEHEVSLQSARNIHSALDPAKYETVLIGIDKAGRWHTLAPDAWLTNPDDPKRIALGPSHDEIALAHAGDDGEIVRVDAPGRAGKLDVVFPIVHGTGGEDGALQGLLTLMDIPFVGAGVLGSAVGMDKAVMKALLRDAGIPTARACLLRDDQPADLDAVADEIGFPCFVKPANQGSSVGISKVKTREALDAAVALAFEFDGKVLVEEHVPGREIECAVLGNDDPQASVAGEIIPHHEFYSYEAKYIDDDGAALAIPADLPPDTMARVQAMAVAAFRALDCAGMARVDFFLKEDGALLVNEINTIPGFTRISMYPKLWEASGIGYGELVDRLIQFALERHARTTARKTHYDIGG